MPCCAMMQPIRNVISKMIGTARQATLSRLCTIEVMRKSRGWVTTRRNDATTAPSMLRLALTV